MTTFKPNKIAIGLALAGLATLPGVASAAAFNLLLDDTSHPTLNQIPFVPSAGKVRVQSTGGVTTGLTAKIIYLDPTGAQVGTPSSVTDALADGNAIVDLPVGTIGTGTQAIILLDAGSGNDLAGAGTGRFGFVNANGIGGYTLAGATADEAAAIAAAKVGKVGVLPIKSYTALSILPNGVEADVLALPTKVLVSFNADPRVAATGALVTNATVMSTTAPPISSTGLLTGVGSGWGPLQFLTRAAGPGLGAPKSQVYMTSTLGGPLTSLAATAGIDDGTNGGNATVTTAVTAIVSPAPALSATNPAVATASDAASMYKATGINGTTVGTVTVYVRMGTTVIDSTTVAAADFTFTGAAAVTAATSLAGVQADANGANTIVKVTLTSDASNRFRYNAATGNLQHSPDGSTWTDVKVTFSGAGVVAGLTGIVSGAAPTAVNVLAGTAEAATITTTRIATTGAYLVDGVKVDFKQAVGTPATTDFNVLTDGQLTDNGDTASTVVTTNAGKTVPIATPTLAGNVVTLQMSGPTTVDWTGGADGGAANDLAVYNQTNFGSGISDDTNGNTVFNGGGDDNRVPFTVAASPFAALAYTQVFNFQTGANQTVGIANPDQISDGLKPIVLSSTWSKTGTTADPDVFGKSIDTGNLVVTFSERLRKHDAADGFLSDGVIVTGSYPLNQSPTGALESLLHAAENIAFGSALPGTAVAPSNFNVPQNLGGSLSASGAIVGDSTPLNTQGVITLDPVANSFLNQKLLVNPRISSRLDNVTLDTTANNALLGTDGLNGDNFFIASIGHEILTDTTGSTTVASVASGPIALFAKAFIGSTADGGYVGHIDITLDKPVKLATGITSLADYFNISVFATNSHNPAGNSTHSTGDSVFSPDFSMLAQTATLSSDGKTISVTIPTELLLKHFGSMTVAFGQGDAKSFTSGPLVLTDVSALPLAANTWDVRLPDFAVGINRLYSMDVKGSISNLPANSQIQAYLAAMPTRSEVKNPAVSVVKGSLSGPAVELKGVALEIHSSVNSDPTCSVVSNITYNSGQNDNPYTSSDLSDVNGDTCSLAYRISRVLAQGSLDPAVKNTKDGATGAGIPAWIVVSQTNDKAPGNAVNTPVSGSTSPEQNNSTIGGASSQENRIGASATLYGSWQDAQAGIDANNRGQRADDRDHPKKVYEVKIDPKTGNISGQLNGNVTIWQDKGIDVAGLKCVRKEGFKINDPSTKSPYVTCDQDFDTAWVFGLTDATGAFRFSISTDRDPSEIKDAFVILSAKKEVTDATGAITGNEWVMLTSADPSMTNFLPFAPELSQTGGTMNVANLSTVDINNIVHVPVVPTSQWQVLGVGNLAINAKATKIDVPRQFVSINKGNGVPATLWQGDYPDTTVSVYGVDQASDAALTLLGNKAGLATQTGGLDGNVAEKNSIAPKTNVDTKGFALAFSDDRFVGGAGVESNAAGGDLFFLTQASSSTSLPKGWSLITIAADTTPSALDSSITAVIRTGTPNSSDEFGGDGHTVIQETQTFFRDETENTLSTLKKGQAVFVFAEKAISGFEFH